MKRQVTLIAGASLVFIAGFAYGQEYARRRAVADLGEFVEELKEDIQYETETEKFPGGDSEEVDPDIYRAPHNAPIREEEPVRAVDEVEDEKPVPYYKQFPNSEEATYSATGDTERAYGDQFGDDEIVFGDASMPHLVEKTYIDTHDPEWPVYELAYFPDEGIYADEYGGVVETWEQLIIDIAEDLYSQGMFTPNETIYVENSNRMCFYEVTYQDMSYQEFAKERINDRKLSDRYE